MPDNTELSVISAPAPAEPAAIGSGWELVRQARRAWRALCVAAAVVGGLLILVLVLEAVRYYDVFARLHWSVGLLYVLIVVALLGLLIGVPAARFLRVPRVVRPPDAHPDHDAPSREALTARARYIVRYCKALRRNDELAESHGEIDTATVDAQSLVYQIDRADDDSIVSLAEDLKQFESERIVALLDPLDKRVDAYIRAEAINVGIGTSISYSGTLDALIVLWRNANMISRIARYYYGRPHLRGSLLIMRDVLAAALVSRSVSTPSHHLGQLVSKWIGHKVALLAGPVVDGAANAVLTMVVGHLAKRRCRSFEAWTRKTVTGVIGGAVGRAMTEARGVVAEVAGRAGRFGAGVVDALMTRIRELFAGVRRETQAEPA